MIESEISTYGRGERGPVSTMKATMNNRKSSTPDEFLESGIDD